MQSDATSQTPNTRDNMKTINTRDLYKRKCELEELRDAVTTAREELDEAGIPKGTPRDEVPEEKWPLIEALDDATEAFSDDEKSELDELETLENEISDFMHGETMIPENDSEDYARQFAEDIGAISGDERWPATCIDWERAARELAMDYSTVEYQGDSYYVRS